MDFPILVNVVIHNSCKNLQTITKTFINTNFTCIEYTVQRDTWYNNIGGVHYFMLFHVSAQ